MLDGETRFDCRIASADEADCGDVNGDGFVNSADAALLKKYLAGWDVLIDEAAADENGDGKINAKDSVLLRQYLAGWNMTLGDGDHTGTE